MHGWFVALAMTVASVPSYVEAAGAPIRGQPIQATTSIPVPVIPSVPSAALKREQVLGGCGGRRVRDPVTKQCRGPGDLDR
jgi:hypothetical protein